MSTVRVLEYLLVLLEDLSSPMELSAELALLAEELDMAADTWLMRLLVLEVEDCDDQAERPQPQQQPPLPRQAPRSAHV